MKILVFLLIASVLFALQVGRIDISYAEIFKILSSFDTSSSQGYVVWNTRFFRIVLAVFVGAGLASAGASFQSIFKNPLASPDILGVASGSAFGAILALILGLNVYFILAFGFVFGIFSLVLTVLIAGANNRIIIILSGIIVSAFFSALISFLKYIADPQDTLPAITYWLLGSLAVGDASGLVACVVGIGIGMSVIFYHRWRHNILMLDDYEAKSLGVNVAKMRVILICASTLVVACVVSFCGIIGWVGLIVPHIARLIVGANVAKVVPYSMVIGAIFMVLTDTIARGATSAELPISVLSAMVGAPFFLFILKKYKGFSL